MAHIILPNKRSRLSQVEHVARTRGMEHLIYASKDINDWSFRETAREAWMSIETDHVWEGTCRKSRIVQPWQIHRGAVDGSGSFAGEHTRIIEHFTASLLWLEQCIKENRARAAAGAHGSLVLPTQGNLDMSVKNALHRGDHPNFFRS